MLEIKCEGSASFDISFAYVVMKRACWDAEPLPDNEVEKTIIYECNECGFSNPRLGIFVVTWSEIHIRYEGGVLNALSHWIFVNQFFFVTSLKLRHF
jgi:hypothetical protein